MEINANASAISRAKSLGVNRRARNRSPKKRARDPHDVVLQALRTARDIANRDARERAGNAESPPSPNSSRQWRLRQDQALATTESAITSSPTSTPTPATPTPATPAPAPATSPLPAPPPPPPPMPIDVCTPGYTGPLGSCVLCEAGKYKSSLGSTPCSTCPANSVTVGKGSVTVIACHCDAGYSGPLGGQDCTACVAGKVCLCSTPRTIFFSYTPHSIEARGGGGLEHKAAARPLD